MLALPTLTSPAACARSTDGPWETRYDHASGIRVGRSGWCCGDGRRSAAAAAAQDRTGVTANSVKVGVLGSPTGVQAVFGQGTSSGAEIVFDEVNAAGGIHGRRIEIVSVDDESTPARSIAGFRRLVDDERVSPCLAPRLSAIGQAMEPTLRAATSVPVFISIFSAAGRDRTLPAPTSFRTGPLERPAAGHRAGGFRAGRTEGRRSRWRSNPTNTGAAAGPV